MHNECIYDIPIGIRFGVRVYDILLAIFIYLFKYPPFLYERTALLSRQWKYRTFSIRRGVYYVLQKFISHVLDVRIPQNSKKKTTYTHSHTKCIVVVVFSIDI